MSVVYEEPGITILHGHVLDELQTLAPHSVHLVCTSPPYWGLRDYNLPPQIWDAPDEPCAHVWGAERHVSVQPQQDHAHGGVTNPAGTRGQQASNKGRAFTASQGTFCQRCPAWKGSLGLEPTIDLYIRHLVQVFVAVKPILHPSGVVAVVIGDSFCSTDKWGGGKSGNHGKHVITFDGEIPSWAVRTRKPPMDGLPPKNLCMVPARFALAMQADGWILRAEIPWVKKNAMPSSVEDRPSVSHETVFLFSKAPRYFWDAEAIQMFLANTNAQRTTSRYNTAMRYGAHNGGNDGLDLLASKMRNGTHHGRNRRTGDWWYESLDQVIADAEAWLSHAKQVRDHGGLLLSPEGEPLGLNVNPQPSSEKHYASFSPKLIEPFIKAGSSEYGVCAKCLAPWKRVLNREPIASNPIITNGRKALHGPTYSRHRQSIHGGQSLVGHTSATLAWFPTCRCGGYQVRITMSQRLAKHRWYRQHWQQRLLAKFGNPVPTTVLDIFGGTGTSLYVARQLGRHAISIDLSEEYCRQQVKRLRQQVLPFEHNPLSANEQQDVTTQTEIAFE